MNLRYCPFCGSNELTCQQDITRFRVVCNDCGAMGPDYRERKVAISAWNSRINEESYEED